MPALFDDPNGPVIYRASGPLPYPDPTEPNLPSSITPRQVTLRDRVTSATIVPFSYAEQVPPTLLMYLCDQMNLEIEKGDTYAMMDPMSPASFGSYWFSNFGAVILLGTISNVEEVHQLDRRGRDWSKDCLGSFYIKPNFPGRSSHVCTGAFLVTDSVRNRGVGRMMGEVYLEWAPLLGYRYSMFNLVYETNVASCRIWDALGFKRIGRVPGCGSLRSYPGEYVDAIIYGRDLGLEGEDYLSEERFDKIRFYLKHGKYPNGADRAEKSRLRSAATNYKVIPGEDGESDKLMLKDKEVVSDPQKQYEIARNVHVQGHGGINKTTATIALKYHWVRIKETVSIVIKNCQECKEANKAATIAAEGHATKQPMESRQRMHTEQSITNAINEMTTSMTFSNPHDQMRNDDPFDTANEYGVNHSQQMDSSVGVMTEYSDIPLDPQIIEMPNITRYAHDPTSDPYGHSGHHHARGMPDFGTPLHHPQSNSVDFHMADNEDMMAAQATAALQQHTPQSMGLVDGTELDNEDLKRQLLAFEDRDTAGRHYGH